jgi:hypothetical protein
MGTIIITNYVETIGVQKFTFAPQRLEVTKRYFRARLAEFLLEKPYESY